MTIPSFTATYPTGWEEHRPWFFSKVGRDLLFRNAIIPGAKITDKTAGDLLISDLAGERISIQTADGATLDGAFFPGANHEKAIIYATGNGNQWEKCGNRINELKKTGASILMVNPRGTGRSKGWGYEKGYVLDIVSAYQYLLQKGYDLNNVLMMGQSMGGALGACAAAVMKEQYPDKEINMISLRSFSTLSTEVDILLKRVGGILANFLRYVARWIGLDIDATKAFQKLDKKAIFYHPDDGIIPYEASLAKDILEKNSKNTTVVKLETIPNVDVHNRPLTIQENCLVNDEVKRMLKIPTPAHKHTFPFEIQNLNGN